VLDVLRPNFVRLQYALLGQQSGEHLRRGFQLRRTTKIVTEISMTKLTAATATTGLYLGRQAGHYYLPIITADGFFIAAGESTRQGANISPPRGRHLRVSLKSHLILISYIRDTQKSSETMMIHAEVQFTARQIHTNRRYSSHRDTETAGADETQGSKLPKANKNNRKTN